jgi:hypothetical protein
MPAAEQQTSLAELIEAHQARRRKLQLQAARFGNETPAHILTEIEQIDAELQQLKAAAATPVSDELVEQLGPVGRYQLWMAHIMRLDTDIGRVADRVEKLHEKFDQLLIALAVEATPVRRRRASG